MLPTTGYSSADLEQFVSIVKTKMHEHELKLLMISGDNAAAHQSYFAKLMEDHQQQAFPLIDWPFTYFGMTAIKAKAIAY